ncbi:MAG: bifunctional 4-hydroxy-2-oxoglutarate aldolase/2-dehydro-3-deoxy-phosphogluconate aldolase [Thermosynechococcaceae cyanobacterium]
MGFSSQGWLDRLRQQRAIAVIRIDDFNVGIQMATAVAQGGIKILEITWNSDRPAALIQHLRESLPDCWIGGGTILDRNQLQEAIAAGAQFVFCPHSDRALIDFCQDRGLPMVAGALTPTEIITAWQAGCASVKVFPIQAVGGVSYLQHLRSPLGQIPLIPTGGVTLENAAGFIQAGAIAVGIAGALFPSTLVKTNNWITISARAQTLREALGFTPEDGTKPI